MNKSDRIALIAVPMAIVIGVLIAIAGSHRGAVYAGVPVFALAVAVAFAIQALAFIPAFLSQSEKFYDLCGSVTYISVILIAVVLSPGIDARAALIAALVVIWAIRLGIFLFMRIRRAGKDDRFDALKPSFIRFLNVWIMQGLWVTFTAAAALAAISSTLRKPIDAITAIGFMLWLCGFLFEVVADAQKRRFSKDPANRGRFIHTGLWSLSRHPNYFGEIMLWVGIAVIAAPVLRGWQWLTLLSPLFVYVLLTRISGIPLLEKKAEQKWGGQEAYETYKKKTPVLIPRLFGRDHCTNEV